jgi:hypothetical protein
VAVLCVVPRPRPLGEQEVQQKHELRLNAHFQKMSAEANRFQFPIDY